MSGIEIAALGAMGAAYLDARFNIVNDLITLRQFVSCALNWARLDRRGDVSTYLIFEQMVRKNPDKDFLRYLEPVTASSNDKDEPLGTEYVYRAYTYAETARLVQIYATYLSKAHNIQSGDIIALDFVNKPEFVIVWFALWCLGATPAMINYRLQNASLVHCVKISKARLLIVDDEVRENGEAVSDELKGHQITTLIVDKLHFEQVFRNYMPHHYVHRKLKGSDPACYIYTSGTTGLPKAANFSWKKANWGPRIYAQVSGFTKNQVLYSAMPLYHSTAAILGLLATLITGSTYAIGHNFSTKTFWTQARLSGATAIQYVGETGRYLLNAPPGPDDRAHQVKIAYGNGMRPDVWQKFKDRFNIPVISEFYGATEYPSAITNYQSGLMGVGACAHYGSLITAITRKVRYRIAKIDPETQDLYRDPVTSFAREAATNEPGEFLFKLSPKNVAADFQGYANNSTATNEKLAFNVFSKGDVWVRTGDLLRRDADNCMFFVDRLGDTFRWKSENVSTNEVEEAFEGIPNIDLVVCVGVKVPQHEGRAGFAVVKLQYPDRSLDMTLLACQLRARLPNYAVPVFIKLVTTIAATGNNKVQKKVFREQQIPPPPNETLFWLVNGEYQKLTPQSWARLEQGQHKL